MARKLVVQSDQDSDSDPDGVPLQLQNGNGSTTNGNGKRPLNASESEFSDSDNDGAPLAKRSKPDPSVSPSSTSVTNSNANGASKGQSARGRTPASDSEDDRPLAVTSSVKPAVPPASGLPRNGTTSLTKRPRKSMKEESSDDDDTPLVAKTKAPPRKQAMKRKSSSGRKSAIKKESSDEGATASSEDDIPLKVQTKSTSKPTSSKGRASHAPRKKVKKEESEPDVESEESDDDAMDTSDDTPAPAIKRGASMKKSAPRRSSTANGKMPAEKETKPSKKKEVKSKAKKEEPESPKKGKSRDKTKEEEEEAEELHRWWEQQQIEGDGTQKWNTLEHNGVMFPPPYVRLPKNVKMKYDGRDITLTAEAEEVCGFFAALLETEHAADAKFRENFFKDWRTILKEYPSEHSHLITDLEKCDFRPMYLHFEAEKAAKKAMTAAEKKAAKAAKDELEAPYRECVLDGRKEKVGNFRIEPPGLFRGRGEHPKKGCLKFRVEPKDIILNIGAGAKIPKPNAPGDWHKVVHDQTVTWLANWKENINGNFKYVFLAAGSSIKGQSDMNKFEKARELKEHVARIRKDYEADLKSKVTAERQRATAMYFIDKLALRAGNEKGEDEADTVGCCSLRCEHVTLQPVNQLIFDFLGKDSIRYYKTVEVDPQVFRNIRIFKGDEKTDKDPIFDRVTTAGLNKHLQSYMKGLTAKVFRTYNASITFQQQLDENTPANGTDAEKLAAYTEANRMVAILCNHQKSVSKTHGSSMEKMSDKLRGLKYQRMKLRKILFELDPKLKKKRKDLAEDESDIDEEWIDYWEEELMKKDVEKATKKFEKDNEKLVAEGEKPKPETELTKAKKELEKEYKELSKERKNGEVNTRGYKDTEKVLAAIEKQEDRIRNFKASIDVKEKGKDVSLGTSKINYLDPRITAAWCKKHDIPVSKLFSKTLVAKFPWAMEVENDWSF